VRAGFGRWELVKKQSNKWLGGGKQIVLFSLKYVVYIFLEVDELPA
jgi:hypothetical protein